MKLTVIVPGIRPGNWLRLYNSIAKAFTRGAWEMLIISPYALPRGLEGKENVRIIKDYGTPIRAQQIGLVSSQGEYISWAADDGYYYPGSLDLAFASLEGKDYKTLVVGKYYEGSENPFMNSRKYYQINTHDGSRSRFIHNDCLMVMVGVVSRQLLIELGGWDAVLFEVCPMAYNDLSVRLFNYGAEFIFQQEIMFRCSHMPGHLGDHGPIHDAQVDFDEPMFRKIYNDPKSVERVSIDLDNWKKSPERWVRRFGVA
jgi:hypothetical protein